MPDISYLKEKRNNSISVTIYIFMFNFDSASSTVWRENETT